MAKPVGILRFLGTNCDRDIFNAVEALGAKAEWLWHEDLFTPENYSAFVVPGGFSYGDYLRCGALAAKAPVMKALHEAAEKGFPILGVCNGFQILTETRILPGALVRNESRRFIDTWVDLKHANANKWSSNLSKSTLRLPIAHGEGRFVIDEDQLKGLFDNGQVWWTYSSNPNGSLRDIAGVSNKAKNVCALMPHPERAIHDWMGGEDGREILKTVLQ